MSRSSKLLFPSSSFHSSELTGKWNIEQHITFLTAIVIIIIIIIIIIMAVLHEPLTIDSSLAVAGVNTFSDYMVCSLSFLRKFGSIWSIWSKNKPSFENSILSLPPRL
jgi:hypothetical protein